MVAPGLSDLSIIGVPDNNPQVTPVDLRGFSFHAAAHPIFRYLGRPSDGYRTLAPYNTP
jgi:hypothetical protein